MSRYKSPYGDDTLMAKRQSLAKRMRLAPQAMVFWCKGMPDDKERECFNCGEGFIPDAGRRIIWPGMSDSVVSYQRRAFCSNECSSTGRLPPNLKPNPLGCEVPDKVRITVLCRDKLKCYLCGRDTVYISGDRTNRDDSPTVDHIIPIKRGGTHEPDNLACCCRSCNTIKNNLDPWSIIAMRLALGVLPATTLRRLRRVPDLAELSSLWQLHVCRDGVLQDG